MSLIIYVITDIIHIITIFFLCEMFFRFKRRENIYGKMMWLIIAMSMIGFSIGVYLWDNLIIETIVYAVAICIMLCCIYKEKLLAIMISALWIIVIMGMLDTMSIVLFEMVSKVIEYYNEDVLRLCGAIIPFIFAYVLGRLYNKKLAKGIRTIGVGNLIAFTALTIVDTFVVMVIARVTINEDQRTYKAVYFTAFIIVILGLFLQLGAVILILLQRNVYKEGQKITEKYLEEQKGHYEYLEKRETETKKFRHDLRNHMQMLSILVRKHKYDEFDKYVEEINVNIDNFGNIVTVQNGIVDAIINKYYSEAVNDGIKIDVRGRFPNDCKIEAYDLCTIFSNLLSNALEAAAEAEDKWINVECRYTDNNIIVVVKNSFANKIQLSNGKIKTHKADGDYHGYGLVNVKDSIKKYNGMWDIDIQENVFTMTISFNYVKVEG